MFLWRLTTIGLAVAMVGIALPGLAQPASRSPVQAPAGSPPPAAVVPVGTDSNPAAVQAELQRLAAQLKKLEEVNAAKSEEELQMQRDQFELAREGQVWRVKESALHEKDQALQKDAADRQYYGVLLQFFSALFLLLAIYQGTRAAMLTRWNTQVQAFLQLREGFTKLRPHLPAKFGTDFREFPASHEEMRASIRYWHHAFDEWFTTQRVHPLTLGRLWRVYYRTAVLSNRRSPFMVAALLKAKQLSSCPVDEDFVEVVLGQTADRSTWGQVKAWAQKLDERPGLPEERADQPTTNGDSPRPSGEASLPQVLAVAKELLDQWDAIEETLKATQPKKVKVEPEAPIGERPNASTPALPDSP